MARTRCCWGSFISPLVVSAQGRDDCAFVVRFNGSTVLASKAKPSIARHKERMDCFVASAFARRRASADRSAPRNDGVGVLIQISNNKHGFAFSRRDAPELCVDCHPLKEQEGAGKAGCALHPRSRVQTCTKRTRAYRFSGGNPAFPARWVTAYSALSPVTGLSCHRHP